MMIIADSGSTKCDWKILDGGREVGSLSTMGFNPYFHDEQLIGDTIGLQALLRTYADRVREVWFYSAGCSGPELNSIVERGLRTLFAKAAIVVEHDVLGAALAACQGRPGIACILGTGSNSCHYDGRTTTEVLPSLGYILGDEGSGSYFGRQLLRDYLYMEPMPEGLRAELVQKGHDKRSVLEALYKRPHANVYLASFMPIIATYRNTGYVQDMIRGGMADFLKRHVCCYPDHREVPVCFVGSIAFLFQDILGEVAQPMGIQVGNIEKNPIDGLVRYHLSRAGRAD
jgi:N-acetylglucosamine kinase-like BadF-type ATPase